jgi:ABC-type glycerol-3-phosphate transport system permease component
MYLGVNKNKFSEKRKEFFQGFGFTSGAVLLMVLVFAYPLVNISISAFKRAGNFIGLENYSALLADPVFITSLKNNFKLLIIVPFIIFIALVLAVVINERPKGWKIHRFTILIPFILPIPVSAFLVIAFALIWREIGFCSILIFSRLSSIDNEIVEASQLDGAGWWRRLRHAVLPQISGVLATVVVLEIITVFFYTFEWVYILTRGGPAGTTMVVDLYIFQQAVTFRSIGIAAAASSSILIILITSLLVVRLVRHQLRMISFNARNRVIKPKITQRTSISIKRAPKTEKRFTLKIKKFLTSLGRQFLLWLLTLIFVLPLYFILVNAFKTKADYGSSPWALPINPTLDSFREAFSRGEIAIWFRNSVIVSFGTVLLVTITAVLATYYVSVGPKKFSKYFRRLFVPLIAIPPIIMIIPLFVLFSNLGLINTFPGAILVFAGLLLPFSCYLLLSFFDTFPREILEAAAVDGSSKLGTLIRIILPNAKPVLGTQFVINLLYVWNSLLIVLIFLQGDDRRTLAAGISVFQGRFFRDTPLVMAASLLVILPMFLVYIFTQRSLRKGLMAGAVK